MSRTLIRCLVGLWFLCLNAYSEDAYENKFLEEQAELRPLLERGRAQYRYGDYSGAQETFRSVEVRDPDNAEAKYYQAKIAELLQKQSYLDHKKTREQMLEEVSRSWQRPQVRLAEEQSEALLGDESPVLEKMRSIVLPRVSFSEMSLSRAVETLSDLSEEFDSEPDAADKGVNIVLIDPEQKSPKVSLTLRNVTLDKALSFVTKSVNYQYDVEQGAVVVRAGEGVSSSLLETEFFPISRATVIRLTGTSVRLKDKKDRAGDLSIQEEEKALLNFFQRAGVLFDGDPGRSLAFDGTQLIATQTPRNLQRLRNILRRYQETKQVEIEAKFMEVQQGALEELGFQWNVTHGSSSYQTQALNSSASALRNLGGAFSTQGTTAGDGSITFANGAPTVPIGNSPPAFPNNINLGVGTPNIANILGVTDGWRVNLIIKALEQKTGTDLMSAPKLTVLSGKTAEIVVAQELRYPQSYGKINSAVGTSNSTLVTGGSAGVTITAGTPQDFTVREVGVQMQVTPTVEDDNQSISLKLEPEVTEFEGFVEYGGSSVAIASGTTVNVPSGFFQPIFSVRRIQTEVTIYDGATVIMGGLTREQIKEVDDRVPVLGNIPLLGRLFRSKGETSQKRNLLIFVTANMISPGGAPSKQLVGNVPPGGLFQNPVIVTPAGATQRGED